MYCPECEIILPYDKAPEITACTVCGQPLQATVSDVFEHGKYDLAKEKRPTQIRMAQDIEAILTTKRNQTLLAEGGTGIGKSFAYLVPSLLRLQGHRIVISTSTKGLQHQLYYKDTHTLLRKMGLSPATALLYKGADNYACWKLAKEVPEEDKKAFETFIAIAREKRIPADITDWDGTRPWWWPKVSVKNCTGSNCRYYEDCRLHPEKAQLLIVNHYLLAIDLSRTPGWLLGHYDTLIIDEAHKAPTAFRSAFTKTMGRKGIERAIKSIENNELLQVAIDDADVMSSREAVKRLKKLKKFYDTAENQAAQYRDNDTGIIKDRNHVHSLMNAILLQAKDNLNKFIATTRQLHRVYILNEQYDAVIQDPGEVYYCLSELRQIVNVIQNMAEFAIAAGHLKPKDMNEIVSDSRQENASLLDQPQGALVSNYVLTVETGKFVLQPIEIGTLVGPQLEAVHKKIIMSATLALGKDFSFIRGELGLPEGEVTERIYESPFDLHRQAMLYMPRHIPLPAQMKADPDIREQWIRSVTEEIVFLTNVTKGDAFVLFTARSDLEEVLALRRTDPRFAQPDVHLVVQDGDASHALDRYRENDHSVLYGLKTFWEGVDVVGEKLRLVIIPKFPFPHVNDPVISSLKERAGDNWFTEVYIPRMVFDLKQGVGRLIRTKKDFGVVAILDPRIWTGTSNDSRHQKIIEHISAISDPTKRKSMGYGKKAVLATGYTRLTDDFTRVQTFVKTGLRS